MKTRVAQLFLTLGLVLPSAASLAADANLEVFKSGPATVVAGTDLLYEIQVTNYGPAPATNVTVSDVFSIPAVGEGAAGPATCFDGTDNDDDGSTNSADPECAGLIYVGATETCSLTGTTATEGTVTCTLGSLGVGESSNFTIKFHVSPDYLVRKNSIYVANEATVSATETDPVPNNNSDGLETIVEEVADLKVSVFAEPDGSVLAGPGGLTGAHSGATFVYTIFVDNFGPSVARNVEITDTLLSSDKVSIQSCAFSVSQGGGTITQFTCTTSNLVSTQFGTDIGTFRTNFLEPLTPWTQGRLRGSFRMLAKQDMDITSDTRVASDTPDPVVANNQMAINVKVIPVADLSTTTAHTSEVQVDVQPGLVIDTGAPLPAIPETPNYANALNEVTAGRRILFSAKTKNNGPSRAKNVRLEFQLPAGASVLADTLNAQPTPSTKPGSCYTEPAGEPRTTVICEFGTLYETDNADEVGSATPYDDTLAEASFQILIDPSVPDGTQLAIDYLARADEFDKDLGNNGGGVLFDVNNWADLKLRKFAVGTPIAGKTMHYELQVSNQGPSTAHDVTLRDFLPSGVTFVSAFIDEEGTGLKAPLSCGLTIGSNALFCPLGEVPPTGDVPILVFVNVTLNADVAEGTPLTNNADVYLSDTDDPYPSDNSASASVAVHARADLELTKTAADIIAPSTRITFTLTVKNKGTSDAKNVVVTDTLPPTNQATYVTDSGGCSLAGTTLTCPIGTVKNGESKSFNVYMLPKGSKGNVTNTASVTSSTTDTDLSNNNASKTVLIKGGRASKK